MSTNMRGLNTFITDIRHCSNKEQEQKRIEKELAKIRNKFTNLKGLAGYQKKKYVWKLLYIHILGYEVDFGHNECTNLINSPKFSEKYTGYVATSILVSEQNNELFRTIAASVKSDLNSVNEINQSLALAMVGAQAPKALVDELHQDVQKLALQESRNSLFIRKKACLCLLRMFRKYKEYFNPASWASQILLMFEQRYVSLGFITSAASLLLGVCQSGSSQPFEECVPRLIKILHKLAILKDFPLDYNYYATPSPWLQVKLLRLLTYFPPPQASTESHKQLTECLTRIIKKTEVTKSVNKNNADHGILFEAANLVITYGGTIGVDLKNDILKLLGIFISVKEPNLRYLGLETMCKFAIQSVDQIEDHISTIFKSLRDNDISIRKRALELLYLMSTQSTSVKIVEEMLSYAESGADLQIKDDLVLKIAILAEKFADNLYWYVDVIVRMINCSGDFVTEDIWFRIIQIIIGFQKDSNQELQKYAAQKLFQALALPHVHETLVCIGAFILSEYSNFLVESGKEPQKIFDILNKHFQNCSEKGRQMLLNAFVKLGSKYEDLRDQSIMVCQMSGEHFDPDVQQRGVEYLQLLLEEDQVQQKVLSKMPPYSESVQQNNPLLKRIYNLKLGKNESKDPTLINQAKKQAQDEVEKMQSKVSGSSRVNQDSIRTHVDWLKNCPYLQYCADQVCMEGQNIVIPSVDNLLKGNTSLSFSNPNELKNLLTSANGKLLESQEMSIQYKSEYQGHMGKIALQFESSIGAISNLSIMVAQTSGLIFNIHITPVKQGDNAQALLQVMSNDGSLTLPVASIFYEINGLKKQLELALPIFPNKFIQMVDMPHARFVQFYDEYTNNTTNANYFKLDTLIRNPAPPSVPMSEVLKKAGGLFSAGLNLKAQPYPSLEDLQMIWACGQFLHKPPEQPNVLNFPIMVQMQAFEQQTKEVIRVSIRCGGNGDIARNILNLITLYMS